MLDPQLLCSGHVCLGVLSYLQQVVEALFDQWRFAGGVVPISTRVIAHQKEEWSVLCGFVLPIVVRKFCQWETIHPIGLLMVSEEAQIRLHPLVIPF